MNGASQKINYYVFELNLFRLFNFAIVPHAMFVVKIMIKAKIYAKYIVSAKLCNFSTSAGTLARGGSRDPMFQSEDFFFKSS